MWQRGKYPIGVKRWKLWGKDEIEQLRKLYPTHSAIELSKIFGRTPAVIRHKARSLGLGKTKEFLRQLGVKASYARKKLRRWSLEDESKLKELWLKMSLKQLSKVLGRSKQAIWQKAQRLGLSSRGKARISGSSIVRKGALGERIAEGMFNELGYQVVKRGSSMTEFDFLVDKDGELYALNVKYGKWAALSSRNLRRLVGKHEKSAILYITHNKECFFLPIQKLR